MSNTSSTGTGSVIITSDGSIIARDDTYTIMTTTGTGAITSPWVSSDTTYTWAPTSMYVDEATGETIIGSEEIEKYFRKKFFAEDLKKIIDE